MRTVLLLCLTVGTAVSMHALAEDARPTPDEARRARVFASVGNVTITIGDIEDAIASRRAHVQKRLAEDPDELKALADAQLENELFYQGAEKLGYADDPSVQRFVNQTLVKVFVRREFEEAVTPDDVPAAEVASYYEAHPEEFRRPEMRRARHILVASKADAEEVLEALKTGEKKTFRALAKERSLDTETNIRGGDLLYFTADGSVVGREASGKIDPTLAKAAFSLKDTGDLSGPLDLGDGKWSVLELTGIRPERVRSLEQASGNIRRRLWRDEREATLDAFIAKLRTELEPEVYPERMDAIVLPAASEPVEAPKQ
ncbi:MAG: peptidyl-prolyl cis-trans isomerase [Deltaproteobacteria bacterium]|nr:peptidyl-prolyl cis-trans isomerase [Deltaproteobacteria bacterium]